MKILKIFNRENIIVLIITFYIFFWDLFLTLGIKFDIRSVTLVLSFFLIKEIIIDLKKNNYTFFYLAFLITLFLISHSFIANNVLNIKFFLSTFFLLYIFAIAYYFGDTILANKNKIIYLFIYLFLISIFFHYMIGFASNPEPFSCGGLKNFFTSKNNYDDVIFLIHFISSYSLIFNENSHLAMSVVGVVIYLLYLISNRNEKNISKIIITLFIIVVFLKSSATLLVGTVFSIIAIFISEYKRLNKYFKFLSISLLIVLCMVFTKDRVCMNKIAMDRNNIKQFENFNPFSKKNMIENALLQVDRSIHKNMEIDRDLYNQLSKKLNKLILDQSISSKLKLELIQLKKLLNSDNYIEIDKQIKKLIEKNILIREQEINKQPIYRSSLSADVFFHALKVTYDSFFIKPLGWGFQGYELAFNNYNNSRNIIKKSLQIYNNSDASNNTFKIVTEFGIFSIIIFLFLIYTSLSKKISLENKIFLLPFLITQFVRGAGYFNGAFILIFFLLITLQFKNINKEKI